MINLPDPPDDTEANRVIFLGVVSTAVALVLCCGGVFGGLRVATECTVQDANALLWLVAVCPSLTFLLVVGASIGVITQQPRRRLVLGIGVGVLITAAAWAAWLPVVARYC